ncbi:hypothetical protein CEJ83_20880, partial [Acinetobacter baumannii]
CEQRASHDYSKYKYVHNTQYAIQYTSMFTRRKTKSLAQQATQANKSYIIQKQRHYYPTSI